MQTLEGYAYFIVVSDVHAYEYVDQEQCFHYAQRDVGVWTVLYEQVGKGQSHGDAEGTDETVETLVDLEVFAMRVYRMFHEKEADERQMS